ncbi:uncharacterized protein Dana_GF12844 [Drosophila ananassae]|uniref:Rotatin N-terminal domain-containing protein n=1 Tax=Drosophila ananassae TaxID=7217 RepID=B3MCB1_DROAN|nr:uncharacterized protein LOC6495690 [Drosophila ananassae]EDV36211.1 uncharacterized protein Dana_GF12844 [Drosophila ananassae]
MSSKQCMSLQLADPHLAKLTSESEEIRMRALEQVETRFIRCLSLGEPLQFKPVLLLKQLIRWFGYTPLLAADRVLAMLLELLRSKYSDAVIRKIPQSRLETELAKVRRILGSEESKRVMDLMEDLELQVIDLYDVARENPARFSVCTVDLTSTGSEASSGSRISQLEANLTPEDYEPAWTQPSVDDVMSMKCMLDMPYSETEPDGIDVQVKVSHLAIRLSDYPAEYLLQTPFIFLHLVRLQRHAVATIGHINRALVACLKQFQRRIQVRRNTLSYAASLDPPGKRGKQLKIESALRVLMDSCTKILNLMLFHSTTHNWHMLELCVEAIRTYDVLNTRVSPLATERFAHMVRKLLSYCNTVEGKDMAKLVETLTIPRLQSLIYNGLLQDTVALNLTYDKDINRVHAKSLIQPIVLDSSYLSCVPDRMKSLSNLICALSAEPSASEQQLIRLKRAYSIALNQLIPKTRMGAVQLLHSHKQICLVVNQMGSETLVKLLFDAILECTPLYVGNAQLRKEADSLLLNLLDMPDQHLREYVYRLMPRPVVSHFHSFMNKTAYMPGCNNLDLARHHILGLPLSSKVLRKLILDSWDPNAPDQIAQWCIDYPTMFLKLHCVLPDADFHQMFQVVLPVLSLMVSRSITNNQLHKILWQLFEPDVTCLEPPVMLRGYVCYLYHSDAQLRRDATAKVAYLLQYQDYMNKYRPVIDELPNEIFIHGLELFETSVDYNTVFTERTEEPFQGQRSLDALLRLLQTKDLKPSIRKSTLAQLNVLLQNWKACEDFSTREEGYRLILETLHNSLKKDSPGDPADILLPAVSILMKLMFQSSRFRREIAGTFEVYVCLLRGLLLLPHETQLRNDGSVCLFQMLWYESITATEDKLVLDVDLTTIKVPINCELDTTLKPTIVAEGVSLEEQLQETHFNGDSLRAAQHWRLYAAHRICQNPVNITQDAVQFLDMSDTLKVKVSDVALVQASQLDIQLRNHLTAASNCSNHKDLEKIVSELQLFLVLMRNAVPASEGTALWQLIHKYMRSVPGNVDDADVYQAILNLCLSCLRFCLPQVMSGLNKAFESDPHHSVMLLLHNRSISLDLLCLISQCLLHLIAAQHCSIETNWHGKLFMQLTEEARAHFDLRQLQHVRCFLRILRRLSERELHFSEAQLLDYCENFIQLSNDLRTSTQTGAQWQRDCLQIICQLQGHVERLPCGQNTADDEGMTFKVLRYLLGMCGHSDSEVRALSWVVMANWITARSVEITGVLSRLDYLPGGLPACCLTTMLDVHEVMLVRELAGRVFILLMPLIGADACIELLRIHNFLKEAHAALKAFHVTPWIATELAGPQHSSEILSCYVGICSQLVVLRPEWCATLCEHSFMNCLSDIMKIPPPPVSFSTAFLELCVGHICELYALCYRDNFEFLQRTICRDSVLLQSFLALTNDVLDLDFPEHMLVQLFKLFLVFCKDSNAHEFICEQLVQQPALFLDFFLYGLHLSYKDTPFQRYTLSSLSMVFIKAQNAPEKTSLLKELELYVLPLDDLMPSDEEEKGLKAQENAVNTISNQLISVCMHSPSSKGETETPSPKSPTPLKFTNAAVLIYHRLDRLFEFHYPPKTFNFLHPPSAGHVQICETLGGLLKLSPWAVHAARQLKLLDRVLNILDTFLSDTNIGNACTYVKRVGAHKSRDILSNLLVLLNMLAQWHSSHHAVITQPAMAVTTVKLLIRMWPWLSHSAPLKKLTVQLAMFLSEHSFEICKQISLVHSGQSHSLLQLMARVADHETTRKETSHSAGNQCVVPALRVMINCCSSAEGRLSLSKMHVLDMFDTILPSTASTINSLNVAKGLKPLVFNAWLGFWEVYSRYDVGAKVCHLHSLITAVRYSTPLNYMRILCLRILRNMCFFSGNRAQLVETSEFINLLRDIINQPVRDLDGAGDSKSHLSSLEEHRLSVLMVWKLFCFGAKYKGMLRGTKLLKMLTGLRLQLTVLKIEKPDRYSDIPYAEDVAGLLKNIHESLQQ